MYIWYKLKFMILFKPTMSRKVNCFLEEQIFVLKSRSLSLSLSVTLSLSLSLCLTLSPFSLPLFLSFLRKVTLAKLRARTLYVFYSEIYKSLHLKKFKSSNSLNEKKKYVSFSFSCVLNSPIYILSL